MRKIFASAVILAYTSTLVSQPPVSPDNPYQTGFKTLDYLYEMKAAGKTLTGQHGRNDWKKMRTVTGKYPALWGEDFLYCVSCNDSKPMTTLADWRALITHDAKQAWKKGAIISLMFHACPPTGTEPCWWDVDGQKNVKANLSTADWQDLTSPTGTLNQKWKARLDVLVPYLQELKDAGVEVMFRPYHEMNQSAFWWGGNATYGPALFRLTHDYLTNTKGLTNLIWVLDMQDLSGFGSATLNNYDPGGSYWDILALDFYNSTTVSLLYTASKYTALQNKANGKPIAIGECTYLPTSSVLTSQPDWAFFMGWKEGDNAGVFDKQNNTTISNLYSSSRAVTIAPGWQTDVICDFDDVYPFIRKSGSVTILPAVDASESPASGKMGVLQVPAGSGGDRTVTLWMDDLFDYGPIDPRDYVGISFDAQTAGTSANVGFGLKLEQSGNTTNNAQIQDMGHAGDYNYFNRYTGAGAWQEVRILFERPNGGTGGILTQLQNKMGTSGYDPAKYDRVVLWVAPYQSQSGAFTLNVDNIRLRRNWNEETKIIQTGKNDDISIFTLSGMIHAKAENDAPVSLKVFMLSGQEIADGVNQIPIAKGIYIVKAVSENTSKVSKVVVQ